MMSPVLGCFFSLLYYFFSDSGANRNPDMKSSSHSARRFRAARGAYARLEECRVTFLKQVNKMLEIVNALPAEVDTLIAKPESPHMDKQERRWGGEGEGKGTREDNTR